MPEPNTVGQTAKSLVEAPATVPDNAYIFALAAYEFYVIIALVMVIALPHLAKAWRTYKGDTASASENEKNIKRLLARIDKHEEQCKSEQLKVREDLREVKTDVKHLTSLMERMIPPK